MQPRYVIVADPASLRCRFFVRELEEFWAESARVPDIQIVDWRQLCAGQLPVDESGPAWLRVESPARDLDVIRGLLQAGQRARAGQRAQQMQRAQQPQRPQAGRRLQHGTESAESWSQLREGWIPPQPLLYAGLRACLLTVDEWLGEHPAVTSPYCMEDVLSLFDKNRTAERLRQNGLPAPASFAADATTGDLPQQVHSTGWEAAYLKLATGSCASGVMSVNAGMTAGVTTTQQLDGQYFNTYRVREVRGDELSDLVRFLLSQTITVQQAIPKTTVGGQNFDVRVVVLHGRVVATVFRVSRHPMTNLHLGGRRGDAQQCRAQIPQRQWLDALDACVSAASLFEVPCVGIDVAFHRYTNRPWILEMNAFGDFFPRWVNAAGQTIHRMEIEHTARMM